MWNPTLNRCVTCSSVDPNYVGDAAGGCICKGGWTLSNVTNKCIACTTFDPNLVSDGGGRCRCANNYYMIS